ncbi:MAG: DUF4390 domain-containing protein [Formivibrio sp.]|nr:DUF4390 domain-containing protein [Formivibrio sp.]
MLAAFLLAAAQGHASGIEPQKAVAVFSDSHIEISSRFNITLSPALEQALQSGWALPFQFEFQLTRPRIYAWAYQISDWFGPTETFTQRLSYQSLTHQYRVNSGGLSRNFSSLNEALSALGIISGWRVLIDSNVVHDGKDFAGRVRLKLDLSQLPKPYQLAAIGQPEWHLDSPWIDLTVASESEAVQP